jgi:hypothetical protein
MVEPQPNEALSARKLVVEIAKFNVTTVYSAPKQPNCCRSFRKVKVEALVMLAEMPGCAEAVKTAKSLNAAMPVILLAANVTSRRAYADQHISSHQPETLVGLLCPIFEDPRKAA